MVVTIRKVLVDIRKAMFAFFICKTIDLNMTIL